MGKNMIDEDENKNVFVYSRSNIERVVINNFDKAGLLGSIIGLGIVASDFSSFPRPTLAVIVALIPLLTAITVSVFFSKFAYKISFDFNKKEVSFYMFRKKGTVTLSIKDIEKVNLNVYITFYANNRIIKYNEVVNKELVKLIEKFMPVNWGTLGKILHRWW